MNSIKWEISFYFLAFIIVTIFYSYATYLMNTQKVKPFSPKIEVISSEDSFLINSIQVKNNYGNCAKINTTGELQEYVNQMEFALNKLKELKKRAEMGHFNE